MRAVITRFPSSDEIEDAVFESLPHLSDSKFWELCDWMLCPSFVELDPPMSDQRIHALTCRVYNERNPNKRQLIETPMNIIASDSLIICLQNLRHNRSNYDTQEDNVANRYNFGNYFPNELADCIRDIFNYRILEQYPNLAQYLKDKYMLDNPIVLRKNR